MPNPRPVALLATSNEEVRSQGLRREQHVSSDANGAYNLWNMTHQPDGDYGHHFAVRRAATDSNASCVVQSGPFVASEFEHDEDDNEHDSNVLVERAAASPLPPRLPGSTLLRAREQVQALAIMMDSERSTLFVDSPVVSDERRFAPLLLANESNGAPEPDER